MANTTITNLPAAVGLTGNEAIPAVQSGINVRITPNQIVALVPSGGTVTQINTSSPITGGPITTTGTIGLQSGGVTNAYLANMASGTVKANITGGSAAPTDATPSQVLDIIGSTRGSVLYRGGSGWTILTPGSSGQVFTANGTGSDPSWTTLAIGPSSLTPTGVTPGSYGSASSVATFTVLASGQLSVAGNQPIQISTSQVTGLGTMATQNANGVAITGGTIDQTTIGSTTPAPGYFTSLSATGTATLGTIAAGLWHGTAIGIAYGGTGATTASAARTNLGAASSGANSDITSLSGLTTPLAENEGGTGYSSYTTGDILYASSSSTLARLNDVATGNALISGGVGVAPSWGKINLSTHITGVLATTNGGTGLSSFTSGGAVYATSSSALTTGTLPIASGGTGITTFGTGVQTALTQNVTGSGGIVLSTSPSLTTPNLGTPSAAVLTNATGLPLTTGVTGTLPVTNGGTGVATLTGFVKGNGTSAFTAQTQITNSDLQYNSVTIGSTSVALGATTSTLAGLSSVTLTADPTTALQASTKQYVDNAITTVANTTYHAAANAATTANLTATYNNGTSGVGATLTNSGALAAFAVDGYTASLNDRILVKDMTTGAYNGIYTVTTVGSGAVAWVLTRATDFNTPGSGPNFIETGAGVYVSSGSVNAASSFVMTTTGAITVGTTALTWTQISSAASVTVTSPLQKTGSVISLTTVPTNLGGTGLTSFTSGGAVYASSGSVLTTGTLPITAGGTGITAFGTGVQTALGQNVTGSGSFVLSTSPTLTTPNLGTPSAATLTNATGLPLTTGVTGTLAATNGGTGLNTFVTGDLLYASSSSALARLADVNTGNVLLSGGVGVAPLWGKVDVTTTITGFAPVTNGGTGTGTAFTAGSIVFAGTSGIYNQNNAKFFWDNTNIRLGINTAAPDAQLTVVSNTQTALPGGTLPAGTDLHVVGANAANTRITQDAFGTGNYPVYTGRQSRGTAALPSASQTDDFLAQFTGRGYGATAFGSTSTGYFAVKAAENFTDTAQGTYASIYTTATGSTSPTEAFRFGPAGQLGIGGATYGTSGYVLTSAGGSAAPTWSQVSASSLSGVLPVANGGTGLASYTIGDILYASGATTLSKLADVAAGNVLLSGGIGSAPSYGKVDLTAAVTGTLPVANGGTGTTTSTGTGSVVLSNSPVLVTPNLGTPSALTLTNATGLPLATGVSGVLGATNGGTGLSSPGTFGNVLTSNGTAWVSSSPSSAGATVSPTSPVSSTQGSIWWDSANTVFDVYYDDGTSTQWVQTPSNYGVTLDLDAGTASTSSWVLLFDCGASV